MAKSRQVRKTLVISSDMTIYNAAAQKTQLLQALQDCQELDIDLSKVSEMDTAGFQVLLLVKREAIKAKKGMRLTAYSNAVTEFMDLFNVVSYFADPIGADIQVMQGSSGAAQAA